LTSTRLLAMCVKDTHHRRANALALSQVAGFLRGWETGRATESSTRAVGCIPWNDAPRLTTVDPVDNQSLIARDDAENARLLGDLKRDVLR
jgi:hypothetical protein